MNNEVAILLATYNGGTYIKEQLDSLLRQTYNDFVCYIRDDGSNDNTIDIIDEYVYKYPSRFFKIKKKDARGGSNINFISLARYAKDNLDYNYYMFCDQDDVWKEDKIEKELSEIKKIDNKDIPCLVYCDQMVVDDKLNIISKTNTSYFNPSHRQAIFKNLAFKNFIPGCTICANKKTIEILSKLNPLNVVVYDWACVQIASIFKDGQIKYIDEPLMMYRQHANNTIGVSEKPSFIKRVINDIKNISTWVNNHQKAIKECKKQINEIIKNIDDTEYSKKFKSIERNIKLIRILLYISNKYTVPSMITYMFL